MFGCLTCRTSRPLAAVKKRCSVLLSVARKVHRTSAAWVMLPVQQLQLNSQTVKAAAWPAEANITTIGCCQLLERSDTPFKQLSSPPAAVPPTSAAARSDRGHLARCTRGIGSSVLRDATYVKTARRILQSVANWLAVLCRSWQLRSMKLTTFLLWGQRCLVNNM